MKKITLLSLAISIAFSSISHAKVDESQVSKLSSSLTPMGAIKAANADGSIPAWNGGITSVPEGYTTGMHHIDPYPNDKVEYTISAANVEQYKSLLTPGQLKLFSTYPDTYKMLSLIHI